MGKENTALVVTVTHHWSAQGLVTLKSHSAGAPSQKRGRCTGKCQPKREVEYNSPVTAVSRTSSLFVYMQINSRRIFRICKSVLMFFAVLKVEAVWVIAVSLKEEGQYHQKWAKVVNYLMSNCVVSPTLPCLSSQQWVVDLGMASSVQNAKAGQAEGAMKSYPWILILGKCGLFRGNSEKFHSLSMCHTTMIIISVFIVAALCLSLCSHENFSDDFDPRVQFSWSPSRMRMKSFLGI